MNKINSKLNRRNNCIGNQDDVFNKRKLNFNNTLDEEFIKTNNILFNETENLNIETIKFPKLTDNEINYFCQANNNCSSFKKPGSLAMQTNPSRIYNVKSEKNVDRRTKVSKHIHDVILRLKSQVFQESNRNPVIADNLDFNKNIYLMKNQFSKAEAVLSKNFEEYRLPKSKIAMNNKEMINVSQLKLNPSPFRINSQSLASSYQPIVDLVKVVKNEIDDSTKTETDESESINSGINETEIKNLIYENQFLEDEIDLLDNLDCEPINVLSNADEDIHSDSESLSSEEILNEVHRCVNKELMDLHLPNHPKNPFIYSLFPNIPPFINFVREGESVLQVPPEYLPKMKWRYSSITPTVVKRVVKRSSFKLTTKSGLKWIGYFGNHMKSSGFRSICEYQKINHIPGSFQIGRKDRLWRNVTLLASKCSKPNEFNFLPKTYCLPADLKILKNIWDDDESRRKAKWMLKPPAGARGIGVRIISKWSQIPKKRAALIQSYVSRPFLINDSKFDLRIYVAVTSCDPLRIYVYGDGLVRFASLKYSKSSKNLSNRFIHLTNYSVNKKNSDYQDNEDHNKCQGHKWTLKTLWRHFEENLNIDWKPIWKSIKDCIVKTIISVEAIFNSNIKMYCTHKNCIYELFGFDVLLDHNLKPWILEVNVSPSLHSNSPLDIEVKSSLVADLFNLVGFQLFQEEEQEEQIIQSSLSNSRRTPISTSSKCSSASKSMNTSEKRLSKAFHKQSSITSLNKTNVRRISLRKQFDDFKNHNFVTDENIVLNGSENLKRKSNISTPYTNNKLTNFSKLQQRGYFNRPLSVNEKLKHKYYIQKSSYEDQSIINTITDKLTVDDARILIESIDEFNRSGNFEVAFPDLSEDIKSYIEYININSGCRYYNYLLVEFMKRYKPINYSEIKKDEMTSGYINAAGLQILEKYSANLYSSSSTDDFWSRPSLKDIAKSRLKLQNSS